MASYCRVDSLASQLPTMLSTLEEQDFLFQLHLNEVPQDDSNEVSIFSLLKKSLTEFLYYMYTY